ncbi:hypothetical protein ACIGZJ_09740 [Kitasatospora sp. NPDC052868]|uniref:hypothetical protein n=1 Tax=Kitasatospora sp. NPDC052868 TaxID=3364060 RepID=UPI0037C5B414
MIPRFEIEVDPSFPAGADIGMPPEDEISEEGYGYFRDVWDISGATRAEAVSVIEGERRLVDLMDRASTTWEEFETLAVAVEMGDPEALPSDFAERYPDSELVEIVGDGEMDKPVLTGLDVGVAGLAWALSSIGCFPAASCRGHLGERPWTDRPVVFFAAEPVTVHWLTHLVRESGCGFADGGERGRLLIVEAPSISNLMDLAFRIVDQAERQSYRG